MAKYQLIFESREEIYGIIPRTKDRIRYTCMLKIRDGGKEPISLEMTFVPPHPFSFYMPETHTIRSKNVTGIYTKVIRYLEKFEIEFKY